MLLGISGSIAAYKTLDLIRLLINHGAKVRIIMTEKAKEFVTPLSLQTISGYPVFDNLFARDIETTMFHINIAKWADLIILIPATADLIARVTNGIANDLVTNVCISSNVPIAIVPAMNQQMYHADITQENLKKLHQRGMLIWGPDVGKQACGDIGPGRMLEPLAVLSYVIEWINFIKKLQHLNIMITAGPTREALDPVRYISNHSSGKMGFSIATAAAQCGAKVTLITGPVNLSTPYGVKRIDINSAIEMKTAVMRTINQQHIFIGNAAVADYRAKNVFLEKIKKHDKDNNLTLQLVKNPDIIADVAALQSNRPFVVGFSAETQHIRKHAQRKRLQKNLDLICANYIGKVGQGFYSETNAVHLFWQKGAKTLPCMNKKLLGKQLINEIINLYNEKNRRKNT
ncbi:bifunctional phosphopantothenoylcysteine decarboxylase/phosphopantothenate--cysteine ligase CoaBC [Pantoea sp. Mhis]|uniref:bifunctional phosphopantothenoylcysteine decarboxylase/phosphopantothenate--cysteine ligase CoaBC n=1 Tax=Pantoea sp. Mhis TaxID=2576759 RepID=UPI0013572504|nr:bifunctional phosphopantothenoylcysteine decarboxylase/phosphopantothenate--cysteine ligase CoaBC [Pantoea sp. Mhis]MXP56658.1 bifunctional phosphopantothenoylcysteine decarboxylase/phosphopantothenate--cysteine ligase CoaBC [Pantoea sp. Mhis]